MLSPICLLSVSLIQEVSLFQFLRYCDGGSFSGNNDTVQPYKGTTLHWRGKRIREAVYDELVTNHGLKDATDVVISGCSAGGLTVYRPICSQSLGLCCC